MAYKVVYEFHKNEGKAKSAIKKIPKDFSKPHIYKMKDGTFAVLAGEYDRLDWAETENAKAEARKTVETQQILAQTSNIELARKQREQEIANLKLKGEAEAEAIKIRARALENIALPKVITSNDLKVLGIDSLIQEATNSSR